LPIAGDFAFAAAFDANFIATESFSLTRATGTATTKVITPGAERDRKLAGEPTAGSLRRRASWLGARCPGLIGLATMTLGKAVRA
jgi:hypothetical protein